MTKLHRLQTPDSPANCWTESRFPSLLPPHWDTLLQSWLWAGRWPRELRSAAPSPPARGGRRRLDQTVAAGAGLKPSQAHQHSLVQHLTALHVGRLNVDAVSPALPEGTTTVTAADATGQTWCTAGSTYTCMSLKHLMQRSDLFSVEKRM